MNSIFRQLGSIGSRSQVRAGVRASNAASAARRAARGRQERVYDNAMKSYRAKGMTPGQAVPRATDRSERFVKRIENNARSKSMYNQQVKMGRNRALGIGALGSIGMMQRGPREQQTMYNRPRPTARGVGRYS